MTAGGFKNVAGCSTKLVQKNFVSLRVPHECSQNPLEEVALARVCYLFVFTWTTTTPIAGSKVPECNSGLIHDWNIGKNLTGAILHRHKNQQRRMWTSYPGLAARATVVHWQVQEGERVREIHCNLKSNHLMVLLFLQNLQIRHTIDLYKVRIYIDISMRATTTVIKSDTCNLRSGSKSLLDLLSIVATSLIEWSWL